MEKILITGTGRCGTTFLIKLFTWLNFDTGYNIDNYKNYIHDNCNSGMERKYNENFYILKNPCFMINIEYILKDTSVNIKKIIIPIRDYELTANSRVKHDKNPGGLWNAKDKTSQILFYRRIMSEYLYITTKYNVETIFIDFDKMINNKEYLFNKHKIILDEKCVDFNLFCKIYDDVSLNSKS